MLVGLVPVQILKYGVLQNYENQAVQQRINLIRSRSQMIAEELSQADYLFGGVSSRLDRQLQQLASLWDGRVVVVNSNFRIIRDTYSIDEGRIIIAKEVLVCFNGESTSNYNAKYRFIEVTVPIRSTATGEVEGLMIISAPTTQIEEGKRSLSRTVNLLQIFLVLAELAIAFYASRALARPFIKVTESLTGNGPLTDEDISMPEYTETRLLADAYNGMRHRLQVQEDSRQEFVSNVSHELKTPLTSMKVLADSLLAQEDAPVELYREFLSDIAEEIDRENKIITDLLALVKLDRKSSDIDIKETNINDLIELILKRLRPIAARQNIELVLEKYKPVLAEVDETKLTLAISNLVENAIKYNKPDGWVHVSLNMDNNFFYIRVEDCGIGIPEADQEFIFERFYRVDKSHSREIGGTGLGLAITRNAVLMHHGAVRVYSKEGEGTTFTVRIPLHYQPEEVDHEV